MFRVLYVAGFVLTHQIALASDSSSPMLRVEGIIERVQSAPLSIVPGQPFELTVTLREPTEPNQFAINHTAHADMVFETDIRLVAGSYVNRWSSQFGALSLSRHEEASDALLDLGTDVHLYVSSSGGHGPESMDFAGGIDFIASSQNSHLWFSFSPTATGLLTGEVTSIEVVPEPEYTTFLLCGSLLGLARFRRRQPK